MLKPTLERLFRETLDAIALHRVLPERLQVQGSRLTIDDTSLDLNDYDRIFVAAIGKAAYPMASTFVELIAPRPVTGVAIGPTVAERPIAGIRTIRGSHPYPDEGSLAGARALLEVVGELGPRDLVVHLLSGGGSALAECPCSPELSLEDLAEVHRLLVTGGGKITDMNVVRKHLSGIKGGRLAAAAAPARQITLYVSDVPVDEPAAIASGPTMPDASTTADLRAIVERLGIGDQLPATVWRLIQSGELEETPKPENPLFERCSWHGLIDNGTAIAALREHAEALDWIVEVDLSVDDWPLERAVDALLQRLAALAARHPGRGVAVISGGELSCPVTGGGRGGRNQAFVLRAAQRIAGQPIAVLSAGTDGIDGNSPAAGAMADGETQARADAAGLSLTDHERNSDAHTLFHALGDDITTGPTGNNVRDLRLLLYA